MAVLPLFLLALIGLLFSMAENPIAPYLPTLLSPLFPAAVAFLILSTCYGLGGILCRLFRFPSAQKYNFFLQLWIGMQTCVYLMFVFSLLGGLSSKAFLMTVIGVNAWLLFKFYRSANKNIEIFSKSFSIPEIALMGLVFGTSVILLLSANTPISWYDSLVYHMALPEYFLSHNHIGSVPENVYSYFPLNAEILNLGCLLLGSDVSAKFLVAFQVLLTAHLVFVFLFEETDNKTLAWISALFILTLHLLYLQIVQSDVDAYVMFGVCVFWIHMIRSPFNHWKEYLLSGVLAGVLLGFKYSTGPLFVIPGVVFLWARHRNTKGLLVFVLATILVSLPWWIKNACCSGNPFFPFLSHWIPSKNWSPEQAIIFERINGAFRNSWKGSVWGFLSILDGAWLWCTLFLLRDATRKYWMILAILPFVFWGLLSQGNIRYILPIYPFLLAVSLSVLHLQEKQIQKWVVRVLLGWGILRCCTLLLICVHDLPYALGTRPHLEKLCSLEDPYFRVREDLNARLTGTVKVLMIGEARTYGLSNSHVAATLFDRNPLENCLYSSNTLEALIKNIKQQGFTHVLINEAERKRLNDSFGKFFPSEAGYYFKPDSKESRLFLELINYIFSKNLLTSPDAKWMGLCQIL